MPREAAIILKGAARRIQREYDLAAEMAWHSAALSRAEKMPRLREFMPRRQKQAAKPQADAWKRQYAAFAAWAESYRKDH